MSGGIVTGISGNHTPQIFGNIGHSCQKSIWYSQ